MRNGVLEISSSATRGNTGSMVNRPSIRIRNKTAIAIAARNSWLFIDELCLVENKLISSILLRTTPSYGNYIGRHQILSETR